VLSKKAMKGSANLMYERQINLLYNYSNNKVELMNTDKQLLVCINGCLLNTCQTSCDS